MGRGVGGWTWEDGARGRCGNIGRVLGLEIDKSRERGRIGC